MPEEKQVKKTSSTEPVINEEADKKLIALLRKAMIMLLITMIIVTAIMLYTTINPQLKKYSQVISMVSILIVMVPFYAMTNTLYRERLRIGRDLVDKRQWKQAIAALEPFAIFTQRFLDRSGEAHYLLSRAYAGIGNTVKAQKCRDFVVKNRKGSEWAAKLDPKSASGQGRPSQTGNASDTEGKPKPPKRKPKRRF